MKTESPPFPLGESYKGTDDAGNVINTEWLGQTFIHTFRNTGVAIRGNKNPNTNAPIRAVALRNTYGAALLPKRLVRRDLTAGYAGLHKAAFYNATLNNALVVMVDPYLPTAGVANNDIFWGILGGAVTALTPTVNTAFNGDIAVGGLLVAATAANSTTTIAGRVANRTITNATDAQGAQDGAAGIIGWALSARTTENTNADILIFMNRNY
jgi:hypothetical protein